MWRNSVSERSRAPSGAPCGERLSPNPILAPGLTGVNPLLIASVTVQGRGERLKLHSSLYFGTPCTKVSPLLTLCTGNRHLSRSFARIPDRRRAEYCKLNQRYRYNGQRPVNVHRTRHSVRYATVRLRQNGTDILRSASEAASRKYPGAWSGPG